MLRFRILLFMAVRMVVNTAHRMVYPFLEYFAPGLGVSMVTYTNALALRAVLGAFSPLLAGIADRRGRKAGMLFGLGLFTIGATLAAVWPVFSMFIVFLILATLGKYVLDPSIHAYTGDRVPYVRRGLAIGLLEMGWSLAFVVGAPLVGFLIQYFGWWAPFPAVAFMGGAAFAAIWFFVPADAPANTGGASPFSNLRPLLTSKPALAGLAVGLLMSAANEGVNLVFGVWLSDSFSIKIAALGVASLVIGVSELMGESLVSLFADRLGKRRAVGVGLLLGVAAAIALPFLGKTLGGAQVGLFLFYIAFEFALVSQISMMTSVNPSARATLMALNIAGQSLGRAVGSLVVGQVYSLGIWGSVAAAILFNLLALYWLSQVRLAESAES